MGTCEPGAQLGFVGHGEKGFCAFQAVTNVHTLLF